VVCVVSDLRISQSEESRKEETTVKELRNSEGLGQLLQMPHPFHYIKIVTFASLIAIDQTKLDNAIRKWGQTLLSSPKTENLSKKTEFVVVVAKMGGFNSLSGIVTRLRAGRPRDCSIPCICKTPLPPLPKRTSGLVEPIQSSSQWIPMVKRPGGEAYRLFSYSTEGKNAWSYTSCVTLI
jgi:hypothetical protein